MTSIAHCIVSEYENLPCRTKMNQKKNNLDSNTPLNLRIVKRERFHSINFTTCCFWSFKISHNFFAKKNLFPVKFYFIFIFLRFKSRLGIFGNIDLYFPTIKGLKFLKYRLCSALQLSRVKYFTKSLKLSEFTL